MHYSCYLLSTSAGAKADDCDDNGWTCLHAASVTQHYELMKFLLQKGANPNAKDNRGVTPLLALARICCSLDATDRTPVPKAELTSSRLYKCMSLLLESGVEIDARDEIDGKTVLHMLCASTYSSLIEWFIDTYKPNLNTRDAYNNTLLHTAASCTNFTVIETLVKYGLDLNAIGNRGQTPLQIVLTRKSRSDRGAMFNIIARDANMFTAIEFQTAPASNRRFRINCALDICCCFLVLLRPKLLGACAACLGALLQYISL